MTEHEKCQNCYFWHKHGEHGVGAIACGGKFIKPNQESGFCEKYNESKSAYDACDEWESPK